MTVGWEQRVWMQVLERLTKPLDSFQKALPKDFDPKLTEEEKRKVYIDNVKQWIWKNCPDAKETFYKGTQEQQVKEITRRALEAAAQIAIKQELDDPIHRFVNVVSEYKKIAPSSKPESQEMKECRLQGELLRKWLKEPALFLTRGRPETTALSDQAPLTAEEEDDFVIIENSGDQESKSSKV